MLSLCRNGASGRGRTRRAQALTLPDNSLRLAASLSDNRTRKHRGRSPRDVFLGAIERLKNTHAESQRAEMHGP